MSDHDRMTALSERFKAAGCPTRGWWWMEQGGPYTVATGNRVPEGMEGEQAVPLVSAEDVSRMFSPEDVTALRQEWASEWEGVSRPNHGDHLLRVADLIERILPTKETQ